MLPRQPLSSRKKGKASGQPGRAVALDLPPDDEGDFEIPGSKASSKAPRARSSRTSPKLSSKKTVDNDFVKPCDDSTLKAAALNIPSVVHLPYQDLAVNCFNAPAKSRLQCTLWEIFSVPRLGPAVRDLGGTSRRSYDVRHFWDLGQEIYQRVVLQDVAALQPIFLMMSPPCTWVCQLMHSNWKRLKRSPEDRLLNLEQACCFIDFCMWLARCQIMLGNVFAMEHPAGSLAWDRASVSWWKILQSKMICSLC